MYTCQAMNCIYGGDKEMIQESESIQVIYVNYLLRSHNQYTAGVAMANLLDWAQKNQNNY